jgi:hypothetical protein
VDRISKSYSKKEITQMALDKMNKKKMLSPSKLNPSKKPRKKKTPMYKAYGGKVDDKNYASCGANIMRTK